MLTCGVAAAQETPLPEPPTNAQPFELACDPLCYLASYPGIFSFNNRQNHTYFFNVMLVYDEDLLSVDEDYLWIVNACWRDDGLIVEVQRVTRKDYPESREGYHFLNTFFEDYFRERLNKDFVKRTIRHVKFGELKFLERKFIESLQLAMRSKSDTVCISELASDLHFKITPKGSLGSTLGSFDADYPGFRELNPSYAKLFDGMRNATKTIFPAWIEEENNKTKGDTAGKK
jgi:hypothetical protein